MTKAMSLAAGVLTLAALAPHARAGLLWAIGSDPANFFVPDQFIQVDTTLQTVTTIATLGDGSLGFNGGLAFGPGGNLYAIANDSFGASSLYQVQGNGALSLIGSAGGLGSGFFGGLTYNTGNSLFYTVVNDFSGDSSLYSITGAGVSTPLGVALGTGYSGLAFDTADGLLYGIGNDNTGFSTLYNFSASGPPTAIAGLGFGYGGLTYDEAGNFFWAISPVSNSGAQLFQITSAGVQSGSMMTLGDGFVELAAPGQASTATPEPGSWIAAGSGLLLLVGTLRFSRRKR